MEKKIKHLELVQGVVNRLSTNSFLLKGWSVVLTSAFFALSVPKANTTFLFLAYVPVTVIWGLDGYFLAQERLFRKLYNHVRTLDEDSIDFSMDVKAVRSNGLPKDWIGAMFSKTLIPFHGVLLLAITLVINAL